MRVLILGGDGYLGWPTAMHFAVRGHQVLAADSYVKREWEKEVGAAPLERVELLAERARRWNRDNENHEIRTSRGDLTNVDYTYSLVHDFRPDAIIHYGEQPSAPFSMIDAVHASTTQANNVVGTLNVLFAMRDVVPDAHLVKLGSMGEYGTPNIAIEEGYLRVEHKGRVDTLPYPKQPGSFYHLSKVHDSANLYFASRAWNLSITDLNQGVVYGVWTNEMALPGGSGTSFHYDGIFGTVLNRFCVQAVAGVPLTVYGSGRQQRAFLNIRDTLQCVDIAVRNPARKGAPRVFNQFTEQFSVQELAARVQEAGQKVKIPVAIRHLNNPRTEADSHYYAPSNASLLRLGLKPSLLSDELVTSMLKHVEKHAAKLTCPK